MTSSYNIDTFYEKLLSICDRKKDAFHLTYGPTVFGPYKDRKHFYGMITENSFVVSRNSKVYRTRYFLSGNYSEGEAGTTNVSLQLERRKSDFYAMLLTPIFVCILLDAFLLIKTDIPVEGLLFFDIPLLAALLWIPVDNYRGRKLLEVFKEEMEIQ